jgi:replicative DNA helicase
MLNPTFGPVNELLWPEFEALEARVNGKSGLSGIPTDIDGLDNFTAGWQPGELVVLSGVTSMGKSALAIRLAVQPAIRNPQHISGLISLELTPNRLVQRIVCAEGRVDLNRLSRGAIHDGEYARLAIAAGQVNITNLQILHSPRLSIDALFASTLKLKERQGLDLLVVDTINLLRADDVVPPPANREQEVGVVVRALKAIALELQIPVVATASLSRGVEQRIDKRPQLTDLRDSGDIENTADMVIFIYRPEYYWGPVDKEGNSLEGKTELIIAKNRNGPLGSIPLMFRQEYGLFEPLPR